MRLAAQGQRVLALARRRAPEGTRELRFDAVRGLFDTRPVSLVHGLAIVAVGIALLLALEVEKAGRRRLS